MYVIGTAGHVDHGKSALVLALTGIDPDRLAEEKARGLTIDLGFAWLTLPSGREVSIVDVPGHERFIKNMLAGVGGIDVALLVVAADEGVMPQTREHLAILDLLQVEHAVVALTKRDLAEDDWLDLVESDVRELLDPTSLRGAPIVRCSAVTRDGLDDLCAELDRALDALPAKPDIQRPRLPVDRVFTMSGFGTVVTGTLVDGRLHVGDRVEIVPGRVAARVRGLQSHKAKEESAQPGTRTAINLSGVAPEALRRGMVVTTPGWLQPTTAMDVRLRIIADALRPLKHNAPVTVHAGAAETSARVRLLEDEQIGPGASGWAQLRLDEPLAVARGDCFVIRSNNATVGGGRVVDTRPRRHRRNERETLDALARLLEGSPDDTALTVLQRIEPATLGELSRASQLGTAALHEAVERQLSEAAIIALDEGPLADTSLLATADGFASLGARAVGLVEQAVTERPLRPGIAREELRSRLGLDAKKFVALESALIREGTLVARAGALDLAGRRVELTAAQQAEAARIVAELRAAGASPPATHAADPDLLAYLEQEEQIVRVAEGLYFVADIHARMQEQVVAALRDSGEITLAQVRDLLGTSRKYAQAFLEDLDRRRVTRRVGDARVLRGVG